MPSPQRHLVVVEPRGHEFEGDEGTSVMEAAHAAGFTWPTVCGGEGACTTCFVTVLEGRENLAAMDGSEYQTLSIVRARFPGLPADAVRLACQARLQGPVRLRKPGVRPA